nr:hypothetical protein CFP56_01043 [Quercus suber]
MRAHRRISSHGVRLVAAVSRTPDQPCTPRTVQSNLEDGTMHYIAACMHGGKGLKYVCISCCIMMGNHSYSSCLWSPSQSPTDSRVRSRQL